MTRKLPAYTVFLIISGAAAVLFTTYGFITAIYRVQTAGLNPFQLVLVGTVLELSVFLFEIPTGLVADVYSRRLSVIIGYALIGAGFALEGTLPLFATILLAQVLWGVGYTFISGAQDAWLADEIGEEQLTQAYLRASQMGRVGSLAGIVIGMSLGTVRLGLPMLIAGAFFVLLSFFLILFMPETGFAPTPRPERNSWGKMTDTFRDGVRVVRGRSMLMLILAITIFFGLSSEGWDRLREAHLLENFSFPTIGPLEGPVLWFGVLSIVGLALAFAATEVIRRRVGEEREEVLIGWQLALNLVVIGGIAFFGLAQGFGPAVAVMTAVYVARSASAPLFRGWINKQIEPQVRATVLSMWGQMDAIGQIVGGPILGAVATAISIPAAMIGVSLLLSPVILLYLVAYRWARGETVPKRASEPLQS